MKINNAVVEPVAIKWDNITFPLKEGTPISIGGNIANDGTAMGLVPVTVYNRPVASDRISILVSGDVDLAEVEKNFGSALETSAKAAMSGIRFHKKDGTIDDSADEKGSALPSVTADDNGDVLTVVSGAWAKATPSGGGGVEFITETYDDATKNRGNAEIPLSKIGGGATHTYSLDKTYNEISAMVEGGKLPVIISAGEYSTAISLVSSYYSSTEDETTFYIVNNLSGREYSADSADGTLTYIDGESS